ncbi:diguanylate cyclase [Xylophilus sp. Leaf220]|uniref:diguanylate cyclase n=1 Tax=Xylophilus sp. Leaf220 TaxID=1735686 RepID=UPI0006FEEF6C|nr:diguanylate cyclase [Xylophilus sp. Leaf220]KQM75554.1 hypothetical protein ASE76_06400 [Xylophilus sp. Leaf220]
MALFAAFAGPALAEDRALLDGRQDAVHLWPSLQVLHVPDGRHRAADLANAPERFASPAGATATLGIVRGPLWLRIPLAVSPEGAGEWILDIDYAPLDRVDLYLLAGDAVVRQVAMGSTLPFAERPLQARTHAVPLRLEARTDYLLLARVETDGPMVLPVFLERPAAFHARAVGEQMLQGLLNGVALCLLVYSLVQWIYLRDALYGKYALMIGGGVMFSLLFSGIGGQYVWRDWQWMNQHAVNLSALVGAGGAFLFIEQALARPGSLRRFGLAMKAGAALTGLLAVGYVLGGFGTEQAAPVINIWVLLPLLMGIPVAVQRTWRGDPLGLPFVVAWALYLCGSAVMVGIVNGRVPANVWTLHAFQFAATVDMLIFLRVLGLRTAALATEARQLRALARTDPLTGLLNRRGLESGLKSALARRARNRLVAVYLLDLDGFKPVNDGHGHDVGDALLAAVAQRLRSTARIDDPVARLGGDEFVIVSAGLQNAEAAETRGQALMRVFETPFEIRGLSLTLGATVGYALAPADGQEPEQLVNRADKAMYAGKQAGRRCLRRYAAAPGAQG